MAGIFLAGAPAVTNEFAREKTSTKAASDGASTSTGSPSVLLVSGLGVGGTVPSSSLKLQLLLEHVSGETLPADKLLGNASGANVVRMIVAGNSCAHDGSGASGVEPIKELDMVMSGFCAALPVDLMPGATDPANVMLPQTPLHPCLLPISQSYQSLNCAPNPYSARIGGWKFLGSAGQPVEDMRKFSAAKADEDDMSDGGERVAVPPEEIECLERSLACRHMAPTGPDSLACYPFTEDDPFVISEEDAPDVYFAGNCSKFATKVLENGTRLVCVPSFAETGVAVKIKLDTLEIEIVKFDV